MKRKLVTIQEVKQIASIEGADRVELARIMGWNCVVKKDEFVVGDIGVYFEVDSFLPIEDRYEFLRSGSYKKNEYMGEKYNELGSSEEGFRIKTVKLRGQISQGLFIPLKNFPELVNVKVGDEVTDLLNVRKWYIPEMKTDIGTIIGDKPFGIPTTDEMRIQSSEHLLECMRGNPYYIATKLEGASSTIYSREIQVGVCSRETELKDDEFSAMWNYFNEKEIPSKLKEYKRSLAIQGEFCGHKIQGNKLRIKGHDFFIFDIFDLDNSKYLSLKEMQEVAMDLGIKTVPIEEIGDSLDYTLEELIERAKGNYESGTKKEGIVIRTLESGTCGENNERTSFKVLNNEYLIKED